MEIEVRDLDNLCRFCLNDGTISVDESITALDGRTVATFLGPSLCPRQVNFNFSYPRNICSKCLETITSFYKFIQVSHKSLKILENILQESTSEPLPPASMEETLSLSAAGGSCVSPYSDKMVATTSLKTPTGVKETSFSEWNDCFESSTSVFEDTQDNVKDKSVQLLKPFKCNHCLKTFEKLSSVVSHQNRVKHPKNEDDLQHLHCKLCNKILHSNQLTKHNMLIHGIAAETEEVSHKFLCNLCGRVLKSSQSLVRHEKMHEGILDFSCAECNAVFATKPGLRFHIRKHFGIVKPYRCGLCEKSFRSKTSLDRHNLWHEGTKAFSCETCNGSFYTRFELKGHVKRVHAPVLHECLYCYKVLASAQGLRTHIMVHKNVRPFQCKLCDKRFTLKQKFNSHLKARHNIESKKGVTIWKDPKTFFSLEKLLAM